MAGRAVCRGINAVEEKKAHEARSEIRNPRSVTEMVENRFDQFVLESNEAFFVEPPVIGVVVATRNWVEQDLH